MNQALFASVYSLVGESLFLDSAIILFGAYWEYMVVLGLIFYLAYNRRGAKKLAAAKNVALAVVAAAVARFGFVNIIRFFYTTDRPFVFEQFTPLVDHVASSGFPSGHATFFMALAVYFFLQKEKNLGWFLFISAIIISVARVAAGIHWPSDILAGWALGALTAALLWYLVNKKSSLKREPINY